MCKGTCNSFAKRWPALSKRKQRSWLECCFAMDFGWNKWWWTLGHMCFFCVLFCWIFGDDGWGEIDGSRCCEDWWICLKSVCFKVVFFFGGGMFYICFICTILVGALYQPMLSTFTVFGQGPHYHCKIGEWSEIGSEAPVEESADWRGWQSDILYVDIPRPPGRVRKADCSWLRECFVLKMCI